MGRDGTGVKAASASSIEITFMFRGVRCRERIALKPTPPNLKRAEQHRAAILYAIQCGTFDYRTTFPGSPRAALFAEYKGEVLTVEQHLETWLSGMKPHVKASTWSGYEKDVRILIAALGAERLADLNRPRIKQWCQGLTCGNKRIANLLSVLRTALASAVDDELIEANPIREWTYERKEAPREKDDVDPFTGEEQAAILLELDGQGANLIRFALWTGLRTSELVALDWGDIDWLRGEIRVRRAMTQAADEPEETKTRAGDRRVKILPPAMDALQAQKGHTFLKGQEVFQNPRTGERWAGDQPIRKTLWAHALKRAGVRYRRPYQTRHTYASMMLSAGEHPMWVAQQMGHSDWSMISRVYGKWIPDAAPDAGSKAVRLFGAETVIRQPLPCLNSPKK